MMHDRATAATSAEPSSPRASSTLGKLAVAGILAAAVAAFFYSGLGDYLSLDTLKANRDRLLLFSEANFATAAALFVTTYCVVTGLSLPGAAILTLAGGFLFGGFLGTLFVNLGATAGATLAFLAARYLLRDSVEARFGSRLGPIQEGFAENAFSYLMTLRMIPLFPFFLVNVVSGLTRVGVGTYIAATSIGIVPGSFVYAYAGRQLGTLDSPKEIASPNVLLAFSLLGVLALAPTIYRKFTRSFGGDSA